MQKTALRKTTLQDIADYCRLSKSTVAQVMSDPDHIKVRRSTVEKVLEAARELNYSTNYAAKRLRTSRTYTIGVVFPNITSFFRELIPFLDRELAANNYFGFFSFWDPSDRQNYRNVYNRLRDHGLDGIITNDKDESIPDINVPTVIYGNRLQYFDCVYPDKEEYARQAVKYLYERGHRKIGFIGQRFGIRIQALWDEFGKYNLMIHPEWFRGCSAYMDKGYQETKALLQTAELPTALITHSDHVAYGALRALEEAGLKVPDDISILSYDNLPESEYSSPPLTTFDQRYEYAAKLLVDTVLKRIENPHLPQQHLGYNLPLVERKSVRTLS